MSAANLNRAQTPNLVKILGIIVFILGLLLLVLIFHPVIKEEAKYLINNKSSNSSEFVVEVLKIESELMQKYPEFGIAIPKINALSPVVANVDSQNSYIYQKALTNGVAHAKGSPTPDQNGGVFLFAHSAGNPLEANRYNAVFYLISKLQINDEIFVSYQNTLYKYFVNKVEKVSPNKVDFLNDFKDGQRLYLMTCWPPGTTLNRLIVTAQKQ